MWPWTNDAVLMTWLLASVVKWSGPFNGNFCVSANQMQMKGPIPRRLQWMSTVSVTMRNDGLLNCYVNFSGQSV